MRDRVGKILVITIILLLLNCCTVFGYTGKGTKNNPYVVSDETDFNTVLTALDKKDNWMYIAVNDNITLTKAITVVGGKYRIFAKGAERTIRRSGDMSAPINKDGEARYCMRIDGNAQVVMGYPETNQKLKMGGNKGAFTNGKISAGWFNVIAGSELTIDSNGHLTNAINNENIDYGSVIRCLGTLIVNGQISNCEGMNGGAIKIWGGRLRINPSANIHNCKSNTEGGAIFISTSGYIEMQGGKIHDCQSAEEGGAIFIGENSTGKIIAGDIYNNYASKSAGGVFSGYGAILYIGETNSTGPNIYNNQSIGSGGGVRCNGGTTEYAGGITYFQSGNIYNNTSGNYGGGIACGAAGSKGYSRIKVYGMNIENNTSSQAGGGIWIPYNAVGTNGGEILIENSQIIGNTTDANGGGMLNNANVVIRNVNISNNKATGNGGAVAINETGILHYKGSQITENKAGNKGSGVHVKGRFIISENGQLSSTNDVFLTRDTFIEVTSDIAGDEILNAVIKSAVTATGTKLVKVDYGSRDSEVELYYLGSAKTECVGHEVQKRYVCSNLSAGQVLRSSKYVSGMGNEWIIISQEYQVTYNKNSKNDVNNMPGNQKKYWNEAITIHTNKVSQGGYILDENKHWNTSINGNGTILKPGSAYTNNANLTLYAQWKKVLPKELFIDAGDRYYVVGQNIELTPEELLKKVKVTDDLNSGSNYKTQITLITEYGSKIIAKGNNLASQEYIDTSKITHFVLTIVAMGEDTSLSKSSNINVFVLQSNNSNNVVRFISANYINTLARDSKWNNGLKNRLVKSLERKSSDKKIVLSKDQIVSIKDSLKNNGYVITKEMNQKLVRGW